MIPDDSKAARCRVVTGLIAKWQPRLRLQAWDIRYNPDRVPDPERAADITRADELALAEIGIHPSVPDSELEACVIHELLHIVLGPMTIRFNNYLAAWAGRKMGPTLLDEMHDAEELLIETIVDGLLGRQQRISGPMAEKMPLFAA